MGKQHSKEASERRKQRKLEKETKEMRAKFHSRCNFVINQLHEFGRNNGFLAWVAYSKEEDKEVVLRTNFFAGNGIAYGVLDKFIQDLSNITKVYVKRMGRDAMNNSNPEGIIRSMCTVLWNEVQERNSPPVEENIEKNED